MIDEVRAGRLRFSWERGAIVVTAANQDLQTGARLTEFEVRALCRDVLAMLDSRPAPVVVPEPVTEDPFA